jgi:transglutaminase-like putative cysteine protease
MSAQVGRFIHWVIRSIGASTLLRLLLLFMILFCVERGLIAIVDQIRPEWLSQTVFYGILVGWLVGRSKVSGWLSSLVVIGFGLSWLTLSVGRMSIPLDGLIATFPALLKQAIYRLPPDLEPFQDVWAMFMQSLAGLAGRLILWIHSLGSSTTIFDPGITNLIWGLALWLVSTWAAWWVRRKAALLVGLLPGTILLVYNIYYTNSRLGIIWLVLTGGGWILFQALESYLKAQRHWQERGMDQAEIEPAVVGTVILLAGALMLAGNLLPSLSIQKISASVQHIFQSRQETNLAESLGLQQTPLFVPYQESNAGGLSTFHAIGPGPQLSQEVVLFVTVEGYVPPPSLPFIYGNVVRSEIRYYWRSQTYDVYTGHIWIANPAWIQDMPANSPYHPDLVILPDNYQLVRQTVERLQPMNTAIFVTGDLLSVDRPSTAAWRASGDLVDARTDEDMYVANSRVQSVTVDQLRLSGNDYPDSIRNYLYLPDELPERVRNLAVQLARDQPTPYDKVMAIQNYLRQFPYSLKVPGAPADRDVADYFLFDLQKGYCDYFATTMVVLLRSVGIPARLVTGFSSGTYDDHNHRFMVVQADAHSWVEVYFPGNGWVEFEPTSNVSPFYHPGESVDQARPALGIPKPVPPAGSWVARVNWMLFRQPARTLGFVLAGFAILLLLWFFLPFESWFLYLRPTDKAIMTIQQRLYRQGRSWGVAPDAARTPHEFAQALSAMFERSARKQPLAPVIVSLKSDVNWLTDVYTRLLFSPHPPTQQEHFHAVNNWARIRRGLRKIRHG